MDTNCEGKQSIMIKMQKDDKDLHKMYRQAANAMRHGKNTPLYKISPEAYAMGLGTPKSLLNAEFHFFGTDNVKNAHAEEQLLRDAGYIDEEDNLIPIIYKLNEYGYREQKDMSDLDNLEGVGDCILLTGNSAAFGTGYHEKDSFAASLEEISGKPVYNLAVNLGGIKSSIRIIDAWSHILKPLCAVTHLCWDTTRLEFDNKVLCGSHNWRRAFVEYHTDKDLIVGIGAKNSPAPRIKNGELSGSKIHSQMVEMWERDMEELLEKPNTVSLMWTVKDFRNDYDVPESTMEKYSKHPNIVDCEWVFPPRDQGEEAMKAYCEEIPSRDTYHTTSKVLKDSAYKVVELMRKNKWIQ